MANPLNTVTWNLLTEACPQMRERLRIGAAAEMAAWMLMHSRRWEAQLKAIPETTDEGAAAWARGMTHLLSRRIDTVTTLMDALPDRFPRVEWNAAIDQLRSWINGGMWKPAEDAGPLTLPPSDSGAAYGD